MRWHQVVQVMLAEMEADAEVTSVVGVMPSSRIYLAGTRQFEVDSVTLLPIVDVDEEVFVPCDFQLDLYAKTMAKLVTLEGALRRLFHHDVYTTLGNINCWSQVIAARSFFGPVSDGYFRRSLDVRVTPVRAKYAQSEVES